MFYIFICPKLILNSLNIIEYGKEALFLKLFYSVIFLYNKRYDVVICHFGRPGNVGAFIKKNWMYNTILLCVFHGRDIREGIKKQGKVYSKLFETADMILSISKYNYDYLSNWGAQNIVNHPNGIDINYFKKKKKEEKTEIIILSVGRLVWEKGYFYAIDAIKKLVLKNPHKNIKYNIIGEGPLRKEIQKKIIYEKLENQIILHGEKFKEEVLEFYNKSDIFLLSSIAEALPVVILEASSCELPVVATNVGSVYEEIENGKSGFLVPPENSKEICKKLNILVNDKEKRLKFGKMGREIIYKNYDAKRLNNKLLKIINIHKID